MFKIQAVLTHAACDADRQYSRPSTLNQHVKMIAAAAIAMAGMAGLPQTVHAATGMSPEQLAQRGEQRLLVAYKPGQKAAAVTAIAKAGGRIIIDLNQDRAFAVELAAGAENGLKSNSAIELIEADPMRYEFGTQAGAKSITPLASSQIVPYGIPMVQADLLPDRHAANRTLCIVDSGFDMAHEDLSGIPAAGANFTGSGEWYTDESSHGTHVAGTVAAVNNTVGVVGVMPNQQVNLFISKVFDASGSASSSTIMEGVRACMDAGANVISMSLGGGRPSVVEARLYAEAARKNILVIAAAGNGGSSAVSYPAGYAPVVSIAAVDDNKTVASFSQFNADVELAAPGVSVLSTVPEGSQLGASLAVGSSAFDVQPMDGSPLTEATGPLADFGLGDTVMPGAMTGSVCLISRGDISFADKVLNCEASGGIGAVIYNNTSGDLYGTLGDADTSIPSVGALQEDGATMLGMLGQSSTVAVFMSDEKYAYYSGTSMATPHASAVAALVWSYFPGCSASQIRSALTNSAQDLGDPGRDVYYGFGLVQAESAYYYAYNNLICAN